MFLFLKFPLRKGPFVLLNVAV